MENPKLDYVSLRPAQPRYEWTRAEKDFMRGDAWFDLDLATRIGPVFNPAFDLFESADKYTLLGDLPGLGIADLDIELTSTSLTIAGERDGDDVAMDTGCHAMERSFGAFVRRFEFPEGVDGARTLVRMRNGVLLVELPKRPVNVLGC